MNITDLFYYYYYRYDYGDQYSTFSSYLSMEKALFQ